MVASLAEQAVGLLAAAGVRLDPGLDASEMAAVQARYEICFGDDHRAFLSLAVPVNTPHPHAGHGWVDWRHDDEANIRARLNYPLDGVIFDIFENDFWPSSWGPCPDTGGASAIGATARRHLETWPTLLPLYSHRYLPADPAPLGSPVFSVVQTDVIHYGADLVDYFTHEWYPSTERPHQEPEHRYPPWSDFELDPSNDDL